MAQESSIHYHSFLWQLQTVEHGLLLIGGICDETLLLAVDQRRCQLSPVSFADIHDAYDLDARLSQHLEALGIDIAILGASVFVPGLTERGGGIIGCPRQSPSSASITVELEELPDGFFLWTQPGGPGLAFQADRTLAEQIMHEIDKFRNEPIPQQADQIQRLLKDRQITLYLIVCDGSGPEGHCWMASADKTSFYFLKDSQFSGA